MDELLDRYRAWLVASGASDRTVEERVSIARRLCEYANTANPVEITAEQVIAWIGRVPARSSKATYYRHVSGFARWLRSTGIHVGFLDGVPVPRARRGTPRPISVTELTDAIHVADDRAAMMLRLAAFAGLRVSEIGRVRGEDVTDDTIYVVGKGDKPASIPLHPSITAHRDGFPRHGWWFPSRCGGPLNRNAVWRAMTKPLRAIGSEASPHQCRHLFGSALLVGGANLRTVQQLLRHADLTSTQIYTQIPDGSLRAAIAGLPDIA